MFFHTGGCPLTLAFFVSNQIVAAIFAIAGIVMMTYADGFHSHSVIGIALVVGSASMSALYKVSTTGSPPRKVSGPHCCIRAPFTVPSPQAGTGHGKLLELDCLPHQGSGRLTAAHVVLSCRFYSNFCWAVQNLERLPYSCLCWPSSMSSSLPVFLSSFILPKWNTGALLTSFLGEISADFQFSY